MSSHPPSRFSLVSVLAAAALLEVIFYRVLRPLLRPDADVLPRWLLHGLLSAASFSLNLLSVLSLVVLAVALFHVVVRGAILGPRRGRLAFALVTALYLPLSFALLLAPGWVESLKLGAGRGQFLLQVCFICLAFLTTITTLPLRAPARFKLGMLLLLLPLLLHFHAYYMVATGRSQLGSGVDVLLLGQEAAMLAVALSALCFLPGRTERAYQGAGRGVAIAVGLLMALSLLGLILMDWELAARLLQHVAGLRLPTERWALLLYTLALGSFSYAIVRLLLLGGLLQLRGFGLLLLGLSGYALQGNHQLALLLVGLLCIAQTADHRGLHFGGLALD